VQASFGLLFNNAEDWAEPGKFEPERFIDTESGKVLRMHRLIPFSTGKRQCPAETLATSQVFLFFAALMQRFKFEPVEKDKPPPVEVASGVTRSPRPFAVKVTRVNSHRALLNNNTK
jgi:cytochrome P450